MDHVLKFYHCKPCDVRWEHRAAWDADSQEDLYPAHELCPKCREHCPPVKSRIIGVPAGTIYVWDDIEVEDEVHAVHRGQAGGPLV